MAAKPGTENKSSDFPEEAGENSEASEVTAIFRNHFIEMNNLYKFYLEELNDIDKVELTKLKSENKMLKEEIKGLKKGSLDMKKLNRDNETLKEEIKDLKKASLAKGSASYFFLKTRELESKLEAKDIEAIRMKYECLNKERALEYMLEMKCRILETTSSQLADVEEVLKSSELELKKKQEETKALKEALDLKTDENEELRRKVQSFKSSYSKICGRI